MLKIPVLGTVKWYLPNDPNIDPESFNPERLIGHDYSPPKGKDNKPLAYVEVRQLNDSAFARAIALQEQEDKNLLSLDFIEHVIRHGVVGWGGLYRGEEPLKPPEFENGPYGERLKQESYESLIPFLGSHLPTLAVHIYMITLPPS